MPEIWRRVLVTGCALGLLASCSRQPAYDLYGAKPGQPLPGLNGDEQRRFDKGKELFTHEFGIEEGLGPTYNANSCWQCHGKPDAPGMAGSDREADWIVQGTEGVYQRLSISDSYDLGKGCKIEAAAFSKSDPSLVWLQSPALLGAGLIDAISDDSIMRNLFRQAQKGPELVGRVNAMFDPLTQRQRIGRFGWKAEQPSLLHAVAGEMDTKMGITTGISAITGSGRVHTDIPGCAIKYLPRDPNDQGFKLVSLTNFLSLLAPPATLPLDASAQRGKEVFRELRCDVCHTPQMVTGPEVTLPLPSSPVPRLEYIEVKALENQTVSLYSDLLLHKMGKGERDEWRTPPLWGLRYRKWFLHDGSARTVDIAISSHGGQAEGVKRAYWKLSEADRKALLAFLNCI